MNTTASNLLYKYRKFDRNAFRILGNKELYFATPENLNDPLDCKWPILNLFDQVIESEEDKDLKIRLSKLRNLMIAHRETGKTELMHETFETFPLTAGVLSLSRNPTDSLLWSHYADGHRGFCIGFDETYFNDLIANWERYGLIGASDMRYLETPLTCVKKLVQEK